MKFQDHYQQFMDEGARRDCILWSKKCEMMIRVLSVIYF